VCVCGAEIDFDSPQSRKIRRSGLGSLSVDVFFFSHAHTVHNSSPHWLQRAGMKGDGWEGGARADGLVGPNGPKASLYPTGA
jgi:hypothetical protein